MATYHNDTLRLSYSYPANYADASSMVGPAFEASMSNDPAAVTAARCISLPFSRMSADGGQMAMVVLVRADSGCLKKKFNAGSLGEFTQGEARGLAASGAKTSFGQPVSFEVGTRPAELIRGSFTLPTGQTMDAMVVCVLDQPDVVCWQFLSSSADALKTMSAFPVSFEGGPSAPLVPSTVVTKP